MTHKNQTLPSIKTGAHVGILGGSFDPPHLCHQLLALSFLALEKIASLWIIPCSNHAFKGNLSDFKHRLAMCKIAFKRMNLVQILDIEDHLPTPNYTFNTLNRILLARPDLTLHLAIGSDLVKDFPQWHKAAKIIDLASVVIFEREAYPLLKLPEVLQKATIHKGYILPDINSTSFREYFGNKTKKNARPFLDRDVISYIETNNLYQ